MITIRLDSPVALGEQIFDGLQAAIATGVVAVGDALPTVRQLAADLGVNLNTVARAYRDLEMYGMVATARGRGTVVTADVRRPPPSTEDARRRLSEDLAAALARAKVSGLSRGDAAGVIDGQMARFYDNRE